jgi:hypothetical protein
VRSAALLTRARALLLVFINFDSMTIGPSSGRPLRRLRALSRWLCLALTLGACAAFANTPQQNLAYERWAQCSRGLVTLDRVSVDGQIRFFYTNPVDRRDVAQCLSDAGRAGPPLPPPVGVAPVGGP